MGLSAEYCLFYSVKNAWRNAMSKK